jgi:hypothetical protein
MGQVSLDDFTISEPGEIIVKPAAAFDPNAMFLAIPAIPPKTSSVGRVTPVGFCD